MKRNGPGRSPRSPICRCDNTESWGQGVQPADPIPPAVVTSYCVPLVRKRIPLKSLISDRMRAQPWLLLGAMEEKVQEAAN